MAENHESTDYLGIEEGYAPAENFSPPEEDLEKLGRLKEMFRKAASWRTPYDREWEIAVEYLRGRQQIYRNRTTGEIIRSYGNPAEKNKLAINNVIRPTHRSLVGKLSKMMPGFSVRPATMDYEEVQAARVSEKFLQYFMEKEAIDIKWLQGQEDIGTFGSAVFQVVWDPEAGNELAFCQECNFTGGDDMIGIECPSCAADLAEAQAEHMEANAIEAAMQGPDVIPQPPPELPEAPILASAKEGDICVKHHDVRDVFIQPYKLCAEDIEYVFLQTPETVSSLRRRFPHMAHVIKAEETVYADSRGGRFYSSDDHDLDRTIYGYDENLDDRVYLYEYHEMPTLRHPEGRIIYFTDSMIIDEVESPYYKLFGRLPFFYLKWALNPGEFWGEGFISQAWHLQKQINTNETNIREYTELITRMKVLMPIGSRINADEFTSGSSQVIKYNAAAGQPVPWKPPPMPQELFSRGAQLEDNIRKQAGITAPEAGITSADPNGRAMAILEAEADQQVGPVMKRNIKEWQCMQKSILILSQEFYSPERQFTITGDDTYGETYAYSEMSLAGGWDLILETEDGFSRNHAVRLNENLQLMQAGVYGMPMYPGDMEPSKRFLRGAKMKVPGMGPDVRSPEYAAAREKLRQIEKGLPFEPFVPEEDPQIFAEVFLGWLRGKGRTAPPEIRQMVRQVWMFYTQMSMGQVTAEQGNAMLGGMSASPAGGQMTAPGGSPNAPDQIPGQGSNVLREAEGMVQQADAGGDTGAKPAGGQEN